jgi:16S rRNA (guanine527-N7)-methyltransferase
VFHVKHEDVDEPGTAAAAVFGERLPQALRYAELLRDTGVTHGLIGPREGARLWGRHLLNCAVLPELIERDARVLDLGSGAGLPGIPIAIARPDLEVVLLEPMARRVAWLEQAVNDLGLTVTVVRGRAEDREIQREWCGADVVTARAVAPLHRLTGWALPLVRPGGRLLAMKGESAALEADRDGALVRRFGGAPPLVVQCGAEYVDPPTTVVVVERLAPGPAGRRSRAGKDAGGRRAGRHSDIGSVRHRRAGSES